MHTNSRLTSLAGLVVGVALFASACSSAAATPGAPTALTIGSTSDTTMGAYLTGQNGMTLYVLTKDTPDTSTCTGTCATKWPPVAVSSGATITGPTGATGTFATITRADGMIQVVYNHMPVYYYSGDSKAGDTTGQGTLGIWFVAPLSGSLATAPAAPASTPAAPATAPGGY